MSTTRNGRWIGELIRATLVLAAGVVVAGVVVVAVAGCGGAGVDSGGLSAGDRKAARAALSTLRSTNISLQLINITARVQSVPAACRVRRMSTDPHTFRVYVFWIPWLGSEPYTWLNMTIGEDIAQDKFHLGIAYPVVPGGKLYPDGRDVNPFMEDATLLSRYGPEQDRKNREVLKAHGGNVFSKPGAKCQVLVNGGLRLLPNP